MSWRIARHCVRTSEGEELAAARDTSKACVLPRTWLSLTVAFGFVVLTCGCGGSESGSLARTEPLSIDGAQFVRGALPSVFGAAETGDRSPSETLPSEDSPSDPPPSEASQGTTLPQTAPAITGIDTAGLTIVPGQSKRFSGRVSKGAVTIAARFLDHGNGYFRFNVGAKDLASTEGEHSWAATINFASDLTPGLARLAFVAIDERGAAGPISVLDVCSLRPFPDNLNACAPKTAPPYLVVSLAWDSGVDLDLRLETPSGNTIGAKAVTEQPVSSVAVAVARGYLERDSNAGCALDYTNRESVVWQQKPEPGLYRVYASLFDACGRAATRFVVSLNSQRALPDGQWTVEQSEIAVGEVLSSDARAGQGTGLFVTEFEVR
jgi:hypothetical protein